MLGSKKSFERKHLFEDLKSHYDYTINESPGDDLVTFFRLDNELVSVTHIDAPIPYDDIHETVQYAYNWETAVEDLRKHQSHLIVSIMRGSDDPIKRFRTFTQVNCSLLRTTNGKGVYNQSLLIPKEDYLAQAELMSQDYLPLNLWIYFGLRKTENGRSGYTYGLKDFGKHEVEILVSKKSYSETRGILFNTAHYVLDYDVIFRDGQTIGFTEDEKISISLSKGHFVDGHTFKLNF